VTIITNSFAVISPTKPGTEKLGIIAYCFTPYKLAHEKTITGASHAEMIAISVRNAKKECLII